MRAFFEISGPNIYIQIVVTIISIAVHLFATRKTQRKETVLELIAIFTIGLAGWFSISSGIFGCIVYADEVAVSIGWPINSGFQKELAFAAILASSVGLASSVTNKVPSRHSQSGGVTGPALSGRKGPCGDSATRICVPRQIPLALKLAIMKYRPR